MAQQQDRHLTIEQLSALIDQQLSVEEQAACEVHLQSCPQCQGLLDDLRQTVALLHALPQPALPRSFALPAEILHPATPVLAARASQQAPLHIDEGRRRVEQRAQARRQVGVLRRTLRTMSTLVAIIGFIFLVSALPIAHGGAATTSAGTTSNSSAANEPYASTAATTPQLKPHAAATKPASSTQGINNGAATPQATSAGTGSQFGNHRNLQPAASSPSPAFDILQSVGSALDPSTLGGRAIDGALLIVLALLGFVIARRGRSLEAT